MTVLKHLEPNGYGLVDKFVGRAKEAAGSVLDDEELIREGRLQWAGAGAARSGKVIEERAKLGRLKQLDAKAERKEG